MTDDEIRAHLADYSRDFGYGAGFSYFVGPLLPYVRLALAGPRHVLYTVTELPPIDNLTPERLDAVSASKPARLVLVSEAAEALGVSEVTLRRRVKGRQAPE